MQKQYIVRLSADERHHLQAVIKKLSGSSQKVRRAQMLLGTPPAGYAKWSLRLLARKAVELGLVETVSHETVRQTLKKTA